MHPDGIGKIAKPPVVVTPFLTARIAAALQQIGAMLNPRYLCNFLGQQCGLVILAAKQPHPMKGDRRHQLIGPQQRLGRPGQPCPGRAGKVDPVRVFELQNHIAGTVPIEHRRTPMRPWPRDPQTIVTVNAVARILARQRHAAFVTNKPGDKRGFPPAGTAEAKVTRHKCIADNTLRRVDQVQARLHSHVPPLIFRAMQMPPPLTDRPALLRNRNRATEFFLHEEVATEVQERLMEVNKTFTAPAIVAPFAKIWRSLGPVVPDDETLALTAHSHDLVVHALGLHWANDPVGQLVQSRHALMPDGLFLGFLFGGQTLQELRACLAVAEAEVTGGLSPRVLPMAEIRDLGALLQRAGFALPVADSFTKTVRYRDAWHLMRDLRLMGEGNALAARLRRPTRRAVLARAAEVYHEQYADADGLIPATFEIICLTGWSPHDSQQKPLRPGSATKSLADALKTAEMTLPRSGRDG